IFFGEGDSFKSTLAALLAVSVQAGCALLPDWVVRQGNVMVLDWESKTKRWHNRIVRVANGLGISAPTIEYRRCHGLLRHLTESIAAQVDALKIALLIVDSVTGAEGSPSDGGGVGEPTQRLFDALRHINTTQLLIDHVPKSAMEGQRTKRHPINSVIKENRARAVFDIQRGDD